MVVGKNKPRTFSNPSKGPVMSSKSAHFTTEHERLNHVAQAAVSFHCVDVLLGFVASREEASTKSD